MPTNLKVLERESDMYESQKVFLRYYMRTFNARKSAVAAGYDQNHGHHLVISLQNIINARLGEDRMSDGELEMRLVDIARGLTAEYITDQGFIDFQKLREDGKAHLVKKVTRTVDGITIEMYNAQRALEVIGKSRGVIKSGIKRHAHAHVVTEEDSELNKLIKKIYQERLEAESGSSEKEVIEADYTEVE